MERLCDGCAYGARYVDLGVCPECGRGRLTGDLYTRELSCSGQHPVTQIGVDFDAPRNCSSRMLYKDFAIVITDGMSHGKLMHLSRWAEKTPVLVHKAIRSGDPVFTGMDVYMLLRTGKRLHDMGVSFKVCPALPVLPRFCDCFPHLETEYAWVLKSDGAAEG
ncbi:MAG: hypothetical protein IJ055_09780 [Oscillospiraceae bacterium]|nr:hypothetical protein [Oscillospiraceae bacterium]